MYVMLMRHGEAVQLLQNDRERPLTSYGQQQSMQSARWMGEFCEQFKCQVDIALVSPFKRARQTYDAVSSQIDIGQHIESDDIVPSGNPALAHDVIDQLIANNPNAGCILLVSHMPFVSYLLDELSLAAHSMLFSTGAVAAIRYDPTHAKGKLVGQFMPE